MSDIVYVDDATFEKEVLESSVPVLVEFGAVWCGPCQRQKPILEQLMQEQPNIKVVLVDIDEAIKVSSKYAVRSVPTLMVFNAGQKISSLVGLSTLKSLSGLLQNI
jgi:thioredoxin 1